ncbi:hypothetical protein Ae168Ps1_1062c [Pseudonocardia sp. Ae168_Ps1]|uniref:DUF4334 domain-containing protein n=1 Tax=unclassified Pseudonocardia TaxID=2619320 RepID=UPI0001FFE8FE|nr:MULTISPECIES: DUF4334 domain-containing protein [unclassified Pseudonocardia]ALE73137.1 hypothetical protein FRP1_08585 [Pseudonocardia sp. EC080625-04]ALL76457.1 hypothetical protein AD006_16145 [Pseudonocardia sp. EC080610-09]ALL83484.1 hypothetical protein AD017_23985 [Pseudonocardia sp. EC080619-01]OLL72685.1 hypothetical protein Ae150APs1_1063c [Pseudonocardia sp. Ae150A_Ps1]OLL78656.1 hypothetical protein Ae168Ps1_1062c [Pseudonocardia sp. Ae168_Ps1]
MTTTAPADTLRYLEHGATIDEALAFFDGLPAVTVGDLLGEWAGGEVPTGNPMDGLLERFGWHGKRFDGPDDVHPLVMDHPRGGRFSLNPALVPLPTLLRYPAALRNAAVARIAAQAGPALATRAPKARLRMTEYRGVLSATMCYDDLPIHDVFRRVDDDTVLGLMDMRGLDRPFVFYLRRE